MNHNIEHYVYKAKFIDDSVCDEVRNMLDDESTWKAFPKDEVNAYEDTKKQTDGLAGSTLSVDWNDLFNNKDFTGLEENYSLALLQNQKTLEKVRSSLKTGLDYYVKEHLKDLPWYDYYRGFTDPKFIKYHQTNDMTEHCDHVRHVFDGKRKGIPTVSMVGSLSGDYEGGYLRFWDKENYYLDKGEVIFFPSNFLYPHRVTEITKGVRYTFVSWVW